MNKSLDEIKKILKEHEKELKEKCGIEEIGIFGSYLRGEAKKGSDVDILVEFKPQAKISLLDFVELENYLGDLLGVKVDLVEKSVWGEKFEGMYSKLPLKEEALRLPGV